MTTGTAIAIGVGGVAVVGGVMYLRAQQQAAAAAAAAAARQQKSSGGIFGTISNVLGGIIGVATGASVVTSGIGLIANSVRGKSGPTAAQTATDFFGGAFFP
ncbi:MAG TPA: hypothetical protein VK510_03145 [Solirubrobacteraceae bacterium]|nr:hypothetical protein [Solirubrobacteraceae bacterium]